MGKAGSLSIGSYSPDFVHSQHFFSMPAVVEKFLSFVQGGIFWSEDYIPLFA
jgi:hypothetical protein